MEKMLEYTEFETKYRTTGNKVFDFKQIMEKIEDPFVFLYTQGPDYYYTKKDGSFLRYRKAESEKRAELTIKTKPEGAVNNIIRKEVNLRVDNNKFETIQEFALISGYEFNFKIYKMCHIYKFNDATVAFYTVIDEKNDTNHFIEIEVKEETISKLTQDEAKDVIRKYEKILSPLNITHRHRLNKSLFEMYYNDIYEKRKQENTDI
jgi:hypothetical protein